MAAVSSTAGSRRCPSGHAPMRFGAACGAATASRSSSTGAWCTASQSSHAWTASDWPPSLELQPGLQFTSPIAGSSTRSAPPMALADLDIVFVVGAPRSGTTWLQTMLAAHPEVASPQETYIFSAYVD